MDDSKDGEFTRTTASLKSLTGKPSSLLPAGLLRRGGQWSLVKKCAMWSLPLSEPWWQAGGSGWGIGAGGRGCFKLELIFP